MPDYPIIEIPLPFTAALQAVPLPPTKPEPAPLPQYPVRPGFTLGRASWVALVIVLAIWFLINHLDAGAGFLGIAGLGAWFWAERLGGRQHERAVEAFHNDFALHLAYPSALEQYEVALMTSAHPDTLLRHREHCMRAVLATVTLPCRPIPFTEKQPRQGRSEAAFARHLQQHFGVDSIHIGRRVRNDDPREGKDWYYPDVVYHDTSGLYIDIEIDEPYVWHTGEPHHCKGQDDARNTFFLRKNWPVVRFTEEQVMREPLLCCQVLAALIFHLTRRQYAARLYHGRLTPCPQWDWFEARRLAGRRARERYSEPTG